MSTTNAFARREQNRLLAALPERDFARLESHLELVHPPLKEVMLAQGQPATHVWFPLSGVASMVTMMEDATTIEVATVGNEGFVGVPTFLGAASMPAQVINQVPGDYLRMEAPFFAAQVRLDGPLVDMLRRYVQGLVTQMAQNAACNRAHPMEERCARWLLMTHDRVGRDHFALTHEFLAQMLGVRRATVTVAVGMLRKAGLIDYARGNVTILDRAGLEAASCECYGIVRREFDRLLA